MIMSRNDHHKQPVDENKYSRIIECPACQGEGKTYYKTYRDDTTQGKYLTQKEDLLSPPNNESYQVYYATCPFCRGQKIAYAWFEIAATQDEILVHIKMIAGGDDSQEEQEGLPIKAVDENMPFRCYLRQKAPLYQEIFDMGENIEILRPLYPIPKHHVPE